MTIAHPLQASTGSYEQSSSVLGAVDTLELSDIGSSGSYILTGPQILASERFSVAHLHEARSGKSKAPSEGICLYRDPLTAATMVSRKRSSLPSSIWRNREHRGRLTGILLSLLLIPH